MGKRFAVRRKINNMYALYMQNEESFNWDCVSGDFSFLPTANDLQNM